MAFLMKKFIMSKDWIVYRKLSLKTCFKVNLNFFVLKTKAKRLKMSSDKSEFYILNKVCSTAI